MNTLQEKSSSCSTLTGFEGFAENISTHKPKVKMATGQVKLLEMEKGKNDEIIKGLKNDEQRKAELHLFEVQKKGIEVEILSFQCAYC